MTRQTDTQSPSSRRLESLADRVAAALAAAGWSAAELDSDYDLLIIRNPAPDRSEYDSFERGSPWDRECDRVLRAIREVVDPLGWVADWGHHDEVIVEPRGGAR